MHRVGLVVHPKREIGAALETLQEWSTRHGVELVQVPAVGAERHVAPSGEAADCDLIVALGGDGTTLAALRFAAPAGRPVLGVACGSLGALTATNAAELEPALERVHAGDWTTRRLPSLVVEARASHRALNDLVVVRHGAGQVSISIYHDDALYIRFGGDGVVVATPLGSSAYTLAAGGPVIAPGASALVVTPLAPHGGCCPPLVAGPDAAVRIVLEAGWGGARVELDGQVETIVEPHGPLVLTARLRPGDATLISLGDVEHVLAGLRRRKILMDSPRMLARDGRNPVEGV